MKPLHTTPGKVYSVHTTTGCTVSDDSGWSKEIDAPEGYFTAHGSKVYISDESATVRELFKLAPIAFGGGGKPGWYDVLRSELAALLGEDNFSLTYAWVDDKFTLTVALALEITDEQMAQVRVLLGSIPPQNLVAEIDEMPLDFARLAYLESSGTEYLNTAALASGDMKITLDFLVVKWGYTCYAFGSNELPEGNIVYTPDYNNANNRAGLYTYGTQNLYFKAGTHKLDTRYLYVFDRNVVYRNGELAAFYDNASMTEEEFVSKRPIMLFAAQHGNGSMHPQGAKRVWKFVIERAGTRVVDFIPALDETGAPCMFDTVTRKPVRNSGTGSFIAGVENQEQLNNLLRKLPDRTGQEVGTLQVRLADELQTPDSVAKLDAMRAKNWEITQAV